MIRPLAEQRGAVRHMLGYLDVEAAAAAIAENIGIDLLDSYQITMLAEAILKLGSAASGVSFGILIDRDQLGARCHATYLDNHALTLREAA